MILLTIPGLVYPGFANARPGGVVHAKGCVVVEWSSACDSQASSSRVQVRKLSSRVLFGSIGFV